MPRPVLATIVGATIMARLTGQSPAQPPVFRIDTHLVQVTVVVHDSRMSACQEAARLP